MQVVRGRRWAECAKSSAGSEVVTWSARRLVAVAWAAAALGTVSCGTGEPGTPAALLASHLGGSSDWSSAGASGEPAPHLAPAAPPASAAYGAPMLLPAADFDPATPGTVVAVSSDVVAVEDPERDVQREYGAARVPGPDQITSVVRTSEPTSPSAGAADVAASATAASMSTPQATADVASLAVAAVVQPTLRSWSVEAGSTLRETLLAWGRSAEREIVFEFPHDMAIEVGGRFEGAFPDALAWLLQGFDRARPRPIARLRSNAVVIQGAKDDLGGGVRS